MEINVLGHTLDKEQTKAATFSSRNAIIIAGAGSGKSLTMVGKIKYLVEQKQVPLNEILAITFTNMAASSLEEKVKSELHEEFTVFTFHKLALSILQEHDTLYHIMPDDTLDYLVYEILNSIGEQFFFQKMFYQKNYFSNQDFLSLQKLMIRFLTLYRSEYYDIQYFDSIIKHARKKEQSILILIKKLYEIYLLEKQSQGCIDFDDIIMMATRLIKEKGLKRHYQYIIIDEYQDTSQVRENLVKAIYDECQSTLTVVGDDFQSIYRFSGCDIHHFLEFPKRFNAKKLYLKNTYRNSQELIHVAGSFILENKKQIFKKLKSSKHISKPIVVLYYHDMKKDFFKALDYISSESLMILGRNNYDIDSVLGSTNILTDKIYYKTIHKAKGLEEENVLIINLSNHQHSIPTKVKDDNILKYILKHQDNYPYEEERRLFYVALTRTKNICYLYVDQKHPSIFVTELIKKYKKYIQIVDL